MAEVSEQEEIPEESVEKRESVDEGVKFRGTEDEGDDLEHIPLEEVFQKLKCSLQGLSTAEAERRLQIVGPNKLEEHKENRIMKFLMFMWNPLSWVMEVAAFLALVVDNGENMPPDWQDFVGIVCLLIINSTVSYLEEHNAGMAAAALMQQLAPRARVLRDGAYKEEDAACIVPGDVITIKLGDVIPADARLLEGDPLQVDQSALTGESIAVIKRPGEEVFSGSICKQGEIEAIVIATGVSTFFGKAAHLVDSTQHTGHFQSVLRTIGNFCICTIVIGLVIEIIVIYGVQRRRYREGIENMLVLLIGGIPIAMPTVLSVTMAVGSHGLATQGAIVKRMTAIEEMAGMDILCSDKTGTLTLNRLTVDKSLIEVLSDEVDAYLIILTAAHASRLENQDAIDSAVVGMLGDPSEARENIQELHFLPFNPTDKRTAITYLTPDGKMHRATKGSPEQVLALITGEDEIKRKVHDIICRYADRGLRTLAVAYQEIPEGIKESEGGPWLMYGLLPLFDPPRHDTAETVRNALELGVNVKMITGDQLAIAKETGRRLGMGINMYPSSALFQTGGRQSSSAGLVEMDEGELVEQADGFAGVFPEHKFLIVKKLQERKHIVGMTGDGVNDAPALKKADIGIAVADATDAARNAADIVLTQPGLSVIIHAILTSRCIFQRMKNYTIYAVTITVRIVLGFLLLSLTWRFNFSPFMILIIAILNDGTIMTISKDRVKPSQYPDSWKLPEVFAQGSSLGVYLALSTLFFYWLIHETQFFEEHFKVHRISGDSEQETAAIYLQVSIVSQALIFVTRSQSWSFMERPGVYLVIAFVIAQLVATIIAAHANWGFAKIHGCGWGWAGVIWLYSLVIYLPLDIIKFLTRYILSGRAWDHVMESKVAFTRKKNYGREARQAQWAAIARTAVSSPETVPAISSPIIPPASSTMGTEISVQARRRAEVAKLAELHVLKGHNEAIAKLRTLDENAILQSHTV